MRDCEWYGCFRQIATPASFPFRKGASRNGGESTAFFARLPLAREEDRLLQCCAEKGLIRLQKGRINSHRVACRGPSQRPGRCAERAARQGRCRSCATPRLRLWVADACSTIKRCGTSCWSGRRRTDARALHLGIHAAAETMRLAVVSGHSGRVKLQGRCCHILQRQTAHAQHRAG